MAYLFALIAILAGLIMIAGGIRRSPWIIPTDRNLFQHPLTFLGMFVPERWLWVAAIVVGASWIAVAVFVVYKVAGAAL
jgi:hypothetical protein